MHPSVLHRIHSFNPLQRIIIVEETLILILIAIINNLTESTILMEENQFRAHGKFFPTLKIVRYFFAYAW